MLHLASRSPRRAELLARLGLDFGVIDLDIPERQGASEAAHEYVRRVAREKAGAGLLEVVAVPGAVVLGADTEVILDGRVFGKPADAVDAAGMLRTLSGRTHEVITAVSLVSAGRETQAVSTSQVQVAALSDADIAACIASGEWDGKAGAYAFMSDDGNDVYGSGGSGGQITLNLQNVVADGNYALPHAPDLENQPVPLSLMVDDAWIAPVAPSGGLWSTAREMAAYVQMALAHGVAPDGERVVSTANLEATWQPGVPMLFGDGTSAILKEATSNYGLSWEVGNYGGLRLISHQGLTYGFNALVSLLPEAGIGIAALTNRDGAGSTLTLALQFRLFELLFAQPSIIDPLLDQARKIAAIKDPRGLYSYCWCTEPLGSFRALSGGAAFLQR